MSNLSELLPAGGGGKNVNFVASGTLGNGKTVILNSDGTVTVVGESSTSVTPYISSTGTAAVANPAATDDTTIDFDSTNANMFVIAYRDAGNSYYGACVVGTISGETITFGSESVFLSANVSYPTLKFNPNTANQFILTFADNGSSGAATAIIGTVSGTSISYSSKYVFNAGTTYYGTFDFDSASTDKFVVVYRDAGNSNYGTARVGTISGSSISYGAESVFNASMTNSPAVSFDPNTANKCTIVYQDGGNSNKGTAVVGTVSSTSISFGAESTFTVATGYWQSIAYDPSVADKFMVAFGDSGTSYHGSGVAATISGTTITFGSTVIFNSATTYEGDMAYDTTLTNAFAITYQSRGNDDGVVIGGSTSGTVISYGAKTVFLTGSGAGNGVGYEKLAFSSAGSKFVIGYKNYANSSYGTAIVGTLTNTANVTNLTSTNFLGITDAAISSGASGSVTIKGGLKSELSSLTPNSIYYVQSDGSVTTASTAPAVRIGKALSSTTLNLEFNS